MPVKRVPLPLLASVLAGAIFSGLFVASWVAYFWGDGDGERAAFCTVVELLAGPLLVGAVQALRGRATCRHPLRFGAWLFLLHPPIWWALRNLENDGAYAAYMAAARDRD
jgi:hypothetical protein